MPKNWWMKFGFIVVLMMLSVAGLVPTAVELALYPEVPVEDLEVDLPRVTKLFEVVVRPTAAAEAEAVIAEDLERFEATLNEEVGFYRGEGKVRVEMRPDGSILGWVDRKRNNAFDQTLTDQEAGSRAFAAGESDAEEVVFRLWLEQVEGGWRLVATDRSQKQVFAHQLGAERQVDAVPVLAAMRAQHQATYGAGWGIPEAWVAKLPSAEASAEELSGLAQREPPLPGWYSWYADKLTDSVLTLGLDLKGGLLLRYSIGVDEALTSKLDSFATDLKNKIQNRAVTTEVQPGQKRILVTFPNAEARGQFDSKILDDFPALIQIAEEGNTLILGLREEYLAQTEEYIITQAVETIRKRVDQFGLANPAVRVEGGQHIMVELPGLSKRRAQEAERVISTTAVLTFKRALRPDEEQRLLAQLAQRGLPEGVRYEGGQLLASNVYAANGAVVRQGRGALRSFVLTNSDLLETELGAREIEAVYEEIEPDPVEGAAPEQQPKPYWRLRLINKDPIITGEHVDDARPAQDPQTNMPYVALNLNSEGARLFGLFTKKRAAGEATEGMFEGMPMEHSVDRLAILLDDTLISDPVVRSEIPGGNVSIEMGAGNRQKVLAEVNNLVISLLSGALAAPIDQEFKTLVGPSLGQDAISSGGQGLLIGLGLVVLFMLVYYKKSGVIANIALMLNVLFIMAIMASLGATLTLPGIAGIVLTIGMAVDANVIIFERVREELRAGESPRKAIQQGYDKAYSSILDGNITTGLAAMVLMEFGSGPVQGFAVTLLIGIVCSVFTAIFVTRLLFEWWLTRFQPSRLSI